VFLARQADSVDEEGLVTDHRGSFQGHQFDAQASGEGRQPWEAERAAVRELVKAARARGEDLTDPGGLGLMTLT
jgi:hypothetical protein